MRNAISTGIILSGVVCLLGSVSLRADALASSGDWNRAKAARYLDARAAWWQAWPKAQRDEDTACISCHTMLPYALSRPLLRTALNEPAAQPPETRMIADASRRVKDWAKIQPYYSDEKFGAGKTAESRSTEAVLNALVLVSEGRAGAPLSETATAALDIALQYQLHEGADRGGWIWQNFHLAPWEGDESSYVGACYMAMALGRAPKSYRDRANVRRAIAEMRDYLDRQASSQPLFNRLHLIWAAKELPALAPRSDIVREAQSDVLTFQHEGGGWRIGDFHAWKRRDGSAATTSDDGYATGLALLALEKRSDKSSIQARARARAWLGEHQEADGAWTASSVNKQRAPTHDAAQFMNDAATAHAVIALLGPISR